MNNVLSTRKLGKEEDPLERVQGQQQGQTDKKERAMYSAELLFGGASEFCFEEIRAELYRKKKLEEANGNIRSNIYIFFGGGRMGLCCSCFVIQVRLSSL